MLMKRKKKKKAELQTELYIVHVAYGRTRLVVNAHVPLGDVKAFPAVV
jgi:hypothetical protein